MLIEAILPNVAWFEIFCPSIFWSVGDLSWSITLDVNCYAVALGNNTVDSDYGLYVLSKLVCAWTAESKIEEGVGI